MNPARIKERLRHMLHLDESPHELAKAFAAGVLVAFTPFLGFHTVIVLLLAWAMRLNKAVAVTGTLVNNPWTMAFVYIGPAWLAAVALRHMGIDVPPLRYHALSERLESVMAVHSVWEQEFWHALFRVFKRYIIALFIGTAAAGIAASAASYFIVLYMVKRFRAKDSRQAQSEGRWSA